MGINYTGGIILPQGGFTTKTVISPTFTTSGSLGNVPGGISYSHTFNATPGYATDVITYSVAGDVPVGLTINPTTGVLSGTPVNTNRSHTFSVKASADTSNATALAVSATITNQNPSWTTNDGELLTAWQNLSYSTTLAATDPNLDPVTFSKTNGTMPTGISIDSITGTVSGTPMATGVSNFTITADDGKNGSTSRAFFIQVLDPAVTWTTTSGSIGTVAGNGTFNVQLVAVASKPGDTISYSKQSGEYPSGVTMDTAGLVSGTAVNTPATYSFTIRATSTSGTYADCAFTITVSNQPPNWTTAAGALTDATQGTAYTKTVVATDPNNDTITYTVTAGNLPTGLTLSSSGVISGTPSETGMSSFTITASDGNGGLTPQAFNITVATATSTYRYLRLAMSALNGDGYIQVQDLRFTANGTQYPNPAVNMTSNTAPSPLVASASTTHAGLEPFYAFTTQGDGSASRWHSTSAANPWLQIDLGAGNGISPTSVHIELYITVSRSINTFTIQGSNTGAFTGEQDTIGGAASLTHASWTSGVARTFPVGPQAPVWVTSAITKYQQATAYSFALSATNSNNATVTYTVTAGALPSGLSLASNGTISGTTNDTATATFTIRATSEGLYTDRAFTMAMSTASPYRYYRMATTALNGDGYLEIQNFRLLDGATVYPTVDMTSNTAPSPLVTSASTTHAGIEPYNAFTSSGGSVSRWHSSYGQEQWLKIDLGNAITATGAVIACNMNNSRSINTFTIQGSETGSFTGEQTVLYTGTGLTSGSWTNNVDRTFTF